MSFLGIDFIETETEEYNWDIDESIKSAREKGFEVVQSTETTLLLDLDDGSSLDRYRKMLPRIANLYGLKESARWSSQSGVGMHVVVTCNAMAFPQRVALQACLGSDPVREALAIAMHADGKENPSVLFKPGKAA